MANDPEALARSQEGSDWGEDGGDAKRLATGGATIPRKSGQTGGEDGGGRVLQTIDLERLA